MSYEEKIVAKLEQMTGQKNLRLEKPKEAKHGDWAFPCFVLARVLKKSPAQIAEDLAKEFALEHVQSKAIGPYLNFTIEDKDLFVQILQKIEEGKILEKAGTKSKVLVESPGPNTNKPLHLGHLRNMLLGMSITKTLQAIGKEVHIVNVNNDRGIHICKSMLAYQLYGKGKTPQSEQKKPDHFVGEYYVKFAREGNSPEKKAELERQAQELLQKWEEGDEKTLLLWKQMNEWALNGFKETYAKIGLVIEKEYFESETYKGGRDIILKGLEKGLFYKDETGAIMVDLERKGLGKKALLRADGTSLYITQDINMAQLRYKEFNFDEMYYIVGNEQDYHFKVLFELFKMLQWPFADKCKHFSYGMIELPEGKMKSREGKVVDTDELIEEVYELAQKAVQERYEDIKEDEVKRRAQIIAMGAIKFFFLKYDPQKNFVFDPKASLSFEGETGPYVQYTYARISSIRRKSKAGQASYESYAQEEIALIKILGEFEDVIKQSAEEMRPNIICHYLLKLSQEFNTYYAKQQIIQDDKKVEADRIALLKAIQEVLKKGLQVLGIETLEVM